MKDWQRKYPDRGTLLEGVLRGDLDIEGHRRMVRCVVDLAVVMAQWIVHRRHYNLQLVEMSIRDIAHDSVADLLAEGLDAGDTRLRRAMARYGAEHPELEPEDMVKAIIVKTIHENMQRLFAEIDPVYARLLRSLRYHAAKSGTLGVVRTVAGDVYFRLPKEDALLDRQAPEYHELRKRISLDRDHRSPAVAVLDACLAYLAPQDEFRRAVFESDVIRLAIEVIGADFGEHLKAMEHVEQVREDTPIIETVEMAVAKTRRWVLDAYVRRGKLSQVEMEAIMQAIRDYAIDLSENQAESHFFYLHRHLTGLTYDRFRSDYRNVFQYVLKAFFTNGSGLLASDTVSIKDKS